MHQVLQMRQIDALVENDRVGTVKPLLTAGLLRNDALNIGAAKLISGHDPLNLGFYFTVDHTNPVDLAAPSIARLDQKGHVVDQAGVASRYGSVALFLQYLPNQRVNNGFELAFARGV